MTDDELDEELFLIARDCRFAIRRYRVFDHPHDLWLHDQLRAELASRGHTEQYGTYGWDDAISNPRKEPAE